MTETGSPRRTPNRGDNVALALIAACHPGPTAAVTTLSVILAIAIGLSPLRIVGVGAAILAGQLAIGWSNDWLDARRDVEAGRTDKPVVTGAVAVSTVRTAFIVAALAVIPLSFALGADAAAASIVLTASGLSYNLWLKKTQYSWLPYAVSFGLLPLVVTFAATPPAVAAWWVVATGSLLGLAAHFANVLPDLEDDRAAGVNGLPHRVGRVGSGLFAFGSLLLASVMVTFGGMMMPAAGAAPGTPSRSSDAAVAAGATPGLLGLLGFAIGLVIAAFGVWLVLTRPPSRLLFQLIIASALIDVVLLALSGSHLLA
ncbi:UbiA family prenyltransferase [Subtercola frigoramans]|uniref:4-hydroxybenzoate polyprenyltransferase n=1 Tax=Subtercola frigoramans TaxID=120298 RepID=A0ABS2L6N2_9MICO|nr:UbiA family prenyltransferase [Subtercola frigoramans]MBM7472654.1 4-hydroxybenzoate polyprenyltransferase [Subtercola frigoramans]